MKYRGKVISAFRVSIPKKMREELGIKLETFYEMETYTKDPKHPKILITFFVF